MISRPAAEAAERAKLLNRPDPRTVASAPLELATSGRSGSCHGGGAAGSGASSGAGATLARSIPYFESRSTVVPYSVCSGLAATIACC